MGFACSQEKNASETDNNDDSNMEQVSGGDCSGGYGKKVDTTASITAMELKDLMFDGREKELVLRGSINEVCQKKGCWIKIAREGGEDLMVTFKDYAFFVPKTCSGKEVYLKGIASLETISVEDQKHYAEDAGKTPEEIAAIKSPKEDLVFEADGVYIQ